jgi:hypothetical protein
MNPEEQLHKLAKTLVASGLTSSVAEAMKKAREILKVREPQPEQTVSSDNLPKVEEISSMRQQAAEDEAVQEILEEDSEKIYRRSSEAD